MNSVAPSCVTPVMPKTQPVTYYCCARCGVELRAPRDGIVLDGNLYRTGAVRGDAEFPDGPVLGPTPGLRGGDDAVTAWCWKDFLDTMGAPALARAEEHASSLDRY